MTLLVHICTLLLVMTAYGGNGDKTSRILQDTTIFELHGQVHAVKYVFIYFIIS
jgi:hypothetical protein